MNKLKPKIWIIAIIAVAIFLRFYQLGINPPSLTWDEAAWGYNAYSLGIDGRDEFGKFLPYKYLESFGDFKPPMYAYLDILPVKLFGLSEFAVRFPSALFGVFTVLTAYFLVRRIFPQSPNKEKYALWASFMLAISPWHIMLSRAAFEANVATFFICFGVFAFLAGVRDKKWYLLLSAASFALSFYTFNTARIVAPLLVLILAVGFRKELFMRKREAVSALVVGVLLIVPIAGFLLSPQAGLRFKEVNIFSDIGVINRANQQIENDGGSLFSKIIHNRRFAYGAEYLSHYFDNLSPGFLFIKGDGNPKFSTQDVGSLYLWELPFFVAGILFLFKRKEGSWWIIPLWLLVSIMPAATARETPHALRIETALPTFQILTAIGVVTFLNWIKNINSGRKLKKLILPAVFLALAGNFIYFSHGYFMHYSREFSGEWQYGYKESVGYVLANQEKYDQINITTELGRPYIYYLFYSKTDPRDFRNDAQINRDAFGFVSVDGFSKYRFAKDLPMIQSKSDRTLYIEVPGFVHPQANIIKTFNLLNGKPALNAYIL
ncbi:MAG: glycosyltransferase family 39 protein [Candidatus Levyibacteriota bacterium]